MGREGGIKNFFVIEKRTIGQNKTFGGETIIFMAIGRGGGRVFFHAGIVLRRYRTGHEREILSAAVHPDGRRFDVDAIRAEEFIFLARQRPEFNHGGFMVHNIPCTVHLDV